MKDFVLRDRKVKRITEMHRRRMINVKEKFKQGLLNRKNTDNLFAISSAKI